MYFLTPSFQEPEPFFVSETETADFKAKWKKRTAAQ